MDRPRLLALLKKHGRSVAAFQSLEPGLHAWWADAPREAAVAYFDTGRAWVAVADPLCAKDDVKEVAQRFYEAAHREDRRASFFCSEQDLGGKKIRIGEEPIWIPSRWPDTLARHRRLREQIRRARAKNVVVRAVEASELAPESPLRKEADAIARAWLDTRPMEPMQFLVTLAPFELPREHRYYAAERNGEMVALLSCIPIYAKNGLFLDDLIRGPHAPNGTTELLIDYAMREASEKGDAIVTLGLAPLSGETSSLLRVLALLGRGLYDFRGVRAFKARLHPNRWEPVFMAHESDASSTLAMIDALTAFAGGSLVRFGARTLVRRPLVAAWLLTLLLVPWTLFLASLALFSHLTVLSYDRNELLGWTAFDAVFVVLLVRAFLKPRVGTYALLAALAACDGALAVRHFAVLGLGATLFTAML
ncbi:MAG: phosphatidylglycerol lysyltransferase domain-containing protein, partial [Polyangiaceae bacterium]